jgi:glycosyltransferase involved in cell wall biosynthesis
MNTPEISVVLATQNAASYVGQCLQTLRKQSESALAEVIVADCSTDGTDEVIRATFPGVRLLHFEPPMEAPSLLREALRWAEGRVIVVTDAHCRFPSDWLAKLRKAHEAEYLVIGGAVEHGRADGLVGWACHFADYGAFMLPAQRRVRTPLAGNHVSYKRSVIEPHLNSMEDGFWKVFFHWDLERQGVRFLFDPDLVIYHSSRDTFSSFSRRYFRNARLFAGLRCKRMSAAGRLMRLLGAPALPPLLFYQRLRTGLGKKGHQIRFLESLPLLAAFVVAWAAGEFIGYLLGPSRLPRKRDLPKQSVTAWG